jgi:hypothetical protein
MSSGKAQQSPQMQAPQATGGWQNFTPWAPAQPGYDAMGSLVQQQAAAGPQYLTPSAHTAQGWNMAERALPGMQGVANTGQGNYNFLSNAADVANNPYVQGMLGVNSQQAMDTLTKQMLPALQSGAVGVNNLGSSRLGLAQGQAIGDTQKALQQANTGLMMNAYQQGLGAQQSALGSMGALQNAMAMPATAMGVIGQSREGYEQARLDAPWKQLQNLGAAQQFLNPLGVTQSGAGTYPGATQSANPYGMTPQQATPYSFPGMTPQQQQSLGVLQPTTPFGLSSQPNPYWNGAT